MKDISNLPVVYEAENALLAIEEEYSIVPDCTTKEGYALTKVRIHDLVKLRTGLETRRKEKKAGALAYGKRLDTCAKELKARIEKLELKHKKEKQKADAEKARVKQEEQDRKDTILKRIEAIKKFADTNGLSSEEIAIKIENLSAAVISEEKYQEFKKVAEEAKDLTGAQLEAAMGDALDKEADERVARHERIRIEEEQRQTQIKLDAEREKQEAVQAKLDQERAAFDAEVKRQALLEAKRQARIKEEQDEKAAEAHAEIDRARKQLEAELATKRKADQAKLDAERAELKADKDRLAKIEQARLDKEAEEKAEAELAAKEAASEEQYQANQAKIVIALFDIANDLPCEGEEDVHKICVAIKDSILKFAIPCVEYVG